MLTKEEVRKIRTSRKLTQAAFAEKVGVSTILVAMTETGQKPVSRQYVQKLANAFGPIKVEIKPQPNQSIAFVITPTELSKEK